MKLKMDTKFGEKLTCFKIDKEFDKFSCDNSKVSKIFTLMGSFWVNYIFVELKKYRGVIFQETAGGYKIWREIDLSY